MIKTINLSSFSSLQIGPTVDVKIIEKIEDIDEDAFIIGGCNNLLFAPTPPPLAILSKEFDFLHVKENLLHIGAATPSGKILSYAKKHDIAHFELMQKLPGTLGGMIKMNAGLKEWEIFNHLVAIKTKNGWIKKEDIEFGYRYTNIKDVIFEAIFEIDKGFDTNLLSMFKKLRDNQPNLPSAGSCFKNPQGNFAGKLLDEVGLKGFKIGNMSFSQTHANFLVNLGDGTYEQALELIELAKSKVLEKFGIHLELEIKIVK
jgi:UDP-N-acetylmuramate dehydrogenase